MEAHGNKVTTRLETTEGRYPPLEVSVDLRPDDTGADVSVAIHIPGEDRFIPEIEQQVINAVHEGLALARCPIPDRGFAFTISVSSPALPDSLHGFHVDRAGQLVALVKGSVLSLLSGVMPEPRMLA